MECSCLVCADIPDDTGLADDVRGTGWCAMRLPVAGVSIAYTIGLWHTFRRPELVMIGLDGRQMQKCLNACVRLGRDQGWPPLDEPFSGVFGGYAAQLRQVHDEWLDPVFGMSGTLTGFYGGEQVPVQQLVWPDRDGRWPWDEDAVAAVRTRQPQLWLPVAEHPEGGWRLVGEMSPSFPFKAAPNSWALTTHAVLAGVPPVLVHFDEGAYDVLDSRGYTADDMCVAYLGDISKLHSGLFELVSPPSDRERSAQMWQRHDIQAQAWLRERGTALIDHPGGTLYTHLVRIHDRLRDLGVATYVQLAGLVHAVYSTDGFSLRLADDRAEIRALIGDEAEALVYRYGATDRGATWDTLAETRELTDRFTGTTEQLSVEETRDLADLTIINELDVYEHSAEIATKHGDYFRTLFARWAPIASPSVTAEAQRVLS